MKTFQLVILATLAYFSLASVEEIQCDEEVPENLAYRKYTLLEAFNTLKDIWDAGDWTANQMNNFTMLRAEFRMILERFFKGNSTSEVLKFLNQTNLDPSPPLGTHHPPHHPGLLIVYANYWLKNKEWEDAFEHFLYKGGFISTTSVTNWGKKYFVSRATDALIGRMQALFLENPNQEIIEEVEIILFSIDRLRKVFGILCGGSFDRLNDNLDYFNQIAEFWDENLKYLYHFKSLNTFNELSSITNDLIFEFKNGMEDHKLTAKKIIYLDFFVRQLFSGHKKYSIPPVLILLNDASVDHNFKLEQILLILMSHFYRSEPSKMYDFMIDFRRRDGGIKDELRSMLNYFQHELIALFNFSNASDQTQILSFLRGMQSFHTGVFFSGINCFLGTKDP